MFVTMATRASLGHIPMTPLNCPSLRTRSLLQDSGLYFLHKLSYSQFCVKIPIFSLPWQQGSVWAKFQLHCYIALPRKPHVWCTIHDSISYLSRVVANFVLEFPLFGYMATRVDLGYISVTPANSLTSRFGAGLSWPLYLLRNSSHTDSHLISKFSLSCQQGYR